VDELGGLERSEQRGGGPAEHGDVLLEQLQGVEGVLDALVHGDVSGHDRDRLDPDVRVPESHHQRDRVVGCGIRVYQKAPHLIPSSPGCRLIEASYYYSCNSC
jgi:hypothetical protein